MQTETEDQLKLVISEGSNRVQLHISTETELAALAKNIPRPGEAEITCELPDWQFVTCLTHFPSGDEQNIILLGDHPGLGVRVTTPVVCVDLGTGLAVTQSGSFYSLHGLRSSADFGLSRLLIAAIKHIVR